MGIIRQTIVDGHRGSSKGTTKEDSAIGKNSYEFMELFKCWEKEQLKRKEEDS